MSHPEKNRGIISLIAVLSIGIFSLALAFLAADESLSELSKNRNSLFAERTFSTSESAMKEGMYQFKTRGQSNLSTFAFPLNDSTTTTISITSTVSTTTIKGTAINGITSHTIVRTMRVIPTSWSAFDYTVGTEGNYISNGNSSVAVTKMTIPKLISTVCSNPSYVAPLGVTIIRGNLSTGRGTTNDSISIVCGNLDIGGGSTLNGLTYVTGTVKLHGNVTVNGIILSIGNVTVSGAKNIVTGEQSPVWDDLLTPGTSLEPGNGTWSNE